MAVSLFFHRESTYRAAFSLLSDTKGATVIHPTGTGKSFVGFRHCEDHPQEAVLWLSPAEYIYRTQCENRRASGGGGSRQYHLLYLIYMMCIHRPGEQ